MANESPTVLDYVKSLLKGKPIHIPPLPSQLEAYVSQEGGASPEQTFTPIAPELAVVEPKADLTGASISNDIIIPPPPAQPVEFPWRALGALGLALAAQISLEPRPDRGWAIGAILYFLAAVCVLWANARHEWKTSALPAHTEGSADYRVRPIAIYIGLPFVLLAFLSFSDNRFTGINVTLWLLAIACFLWAFWQPRLAASAGTSSWAWVKSLPSQLRLPWKISFSGWALLILAASALVIFFRIYRLSQVPPEMVSDQAEKLLDVWDVLNGQASIFFSRNTGREAFQMYLTAAVIKVFGTGYSFLSLKIGTVLCGLLTLPFIYGLGKEAGNRRAGLFAMVLAGVAYWPNVVSRAGLRYTLYPFFAAATLYFLVRGLRSRKPNDFLLAGLFLGAGLHGYSPFRIVPFVVIAAILLYVLHRQSQGARWQAFWWLGIVTVVSLVVFLPLLRYMVDDPNMVAYRALTRIGSLERPLPGPAWQIFLKNLWNALTMFAWDNGEVWVISIPHRPALDIVSGALFHLGVVLVLVRYLRQRHWLDIFLLVSIPLLLLSSILSLAFPSENPILNRTGAAFVPAFVMIGLALDGLLTGIEQKMATWGKSLGWGLALVLIAWSSFNNYDLLFIQYQNLYKQSAWNTSEMGQVVHDFGEIFGSTETVWLVGYPYWVDSRLVGINAGVVTRDMAIWPEQFSTTLSEPRAKMFLINPQDEASANLLQQVYPQGALILYDSRVDKDFYIYLVPPQISK